WWYPVGLPRAARGLDVLHCPTFRAPLRSPVPLVNTVHDLAVLRHPGTFNQWSRRYSRLAVPRVARAARLIVAVSEFTKRELVDAHDPGSIAAGIESALARREELAGLGLERARAFSWVAAAAAIEDVYREAAA